MHVASKPRTGAFGVVSVFVLRKLVIETPVLVTPACLVPWFPSNNPGTDENSRAQLLQSLRQTERHGGSVFLHPHGLRRQRSGLLLF